MEFLMRDLEINKIEANGVEICNLRVKILQSTATEENAEEAGFWFNKNMIF